MLSGGRGKREKRNKKEDCLSHGFDRNFPVGRRTNVERKT